MVAMGQWGFHQTLDMIAAAEVRTRSPEGGPRSRLHAAVERRAEPALIAAVEAFSAQMDAAALRAAERRIAARAQEYGPMVALGAWDVAKATDAIVREESRREVAWPAPREAVAAWAEEAARAEEEVRKATDAVRGQLAQRTEAPAVTPPAVAAKEVARARQGPRMSR